MVAVKGFQEISEDELMDVGGEGALGLVAGVVIVAGIIVLANVFSPKNEFIRSLNSGN